MARVALQSGFVLHRRPYRETSLLIEVFSHDYGRIGLLARGARGTKSRVKALLQPFTPLLLSWSGKGDLLNLTASEAAGLAFKIPVERFYSALYINELLLCLLARGDAHPGLFQPYQQVLAELATASHEELPLRIFEKRLLSEIGYGLLLHCEADTGQPIVAEQTYRYLLDRGPLSATSTDAGIPLSGQSLLALHSETIDSPIALREIKRLTRAAIGLQLNGKPLKTRQLLIEQQRRKNNRTTLPNGREEGFNEF